MRSKIIRQILANQRNSPKNSYVLVDDERVSYEKRQVPILAAGYCQPIVVDNVNYHTTAHAAITPTVLQAFKMMNPTLVTELKVEDTHKSWVPDDIFGKAVGSGYATYAGLLGFNGNGGFKSGMRLEQRDMLVAAAMYTKIHHYAEHFIDLYEVAPPTEAEKDSPKGLRWKLQENLEFLWSDKVEAYHYSVAGGISGMTMYLEKFKYLGIDPEKRFRASLKDAMSQDPRNRNHPTVMSVDAHSKQAIEQVTRLSLSDTFVLDVPRTRVEQQTFREREQLRLEYPPERAPAQHHLQKRTSELSLSVAPNVESLTPIQLAAERVQALRQRPKTEKKFNILDEVQVSLILR